MTTSAAARSAWLGMAYGPGRAPAAPVSHGVHLFNGHPLLGGTQLVAGYPVPVNLNDNWTITDVATSGLVTFNFTATLALPATHWRLLGSDGNWWDTMPLGLTWNGGAGVTERIKLVVRVAIPGSE